MMQHRLTDAMTSDDRETKIWKSRFVAATAAYQEADFKTCEHLLYRLLEGAKSLKEKDFATYTTRVGLGAHCIATGKLKEAEEHLRTVIGALGSAATPPLKELYAVALRFHAAVQVEKGDLASGQKDLEEAAEKLEKLGPDAAVQLAYVLSDLGGLYIVQGNLESAKGYLFNAMDLLKTSLGEENPQFMRADIMYSLCHAKNQEELLDEMESSILQMQY
jgi:tetratricopeptide (TPR) repeat protein